MRCNKVYLYTASNIEGPWVNKGIIYTIDDKYLKKKIDGKNAFWVYAPKLHPELIPNDSKEGAFVLFPSYLDHSVNENLSKNERIVISFNIRISTKTN